MNTEIINLEGKMSISLKSANQFLFINLGPIGGHGWGMAHFVGQYGYEIVGIQCKSVEGIEANCLVSVKKK